jgi:DNA-binding response OmpR family regulator
MRALVIQDDDGLARLLAQAFAAHGYAVTDTPLGEEGVDLAFFERFDVICVDDILPDMAGFDVLRRLRSFDDVTPAMFVSSALKDPDVAARARAAGAQGLLNLPFAMADLTRVLADMREATRGFGRYEPDACGPRG